MLGDPQLTLRLAEGDEQDVRLRPADAADERVVLRGLQLPERRAVRADDLQLRVLRLERRTRRPQHVRLPAEEVHAVTTLGGLPADLPDQFAAGHALRERLRPRPQLRPRDDRHAVGDDAGRLPVDPPQLRRAGRQHAVVHVGRDEVGRPDVALPSDPDLVADPRERPLHRPRPERHSEDRDGSALAAAHPATSAGRSLAKRNSPAVL